MNRMLEELSMNAWPALQNVHYDGWVIRFSNRYTKRANSVYPLYKSRLDLKDKLAYCEAFYNKKEMPTTFKIHDGEALHELDIYLEDQGYHVVDPTDMLMMDLANYEVPEDLSYRVGYGYTDEAARALATTIGADGEDERSLVVRETMSSMMGQILPENFYVFVEVDGEVIGSGNGVVELDYLGIYNVCVNEAYRGKGYGRKIMDAIIKEGLGIGAKKSYLQVVCQNEVAMNMYLDMGYEKQYRYWYRRKDPNGYYA